MNVFRLGLAKNNVKVIECHTRKTGLAKYISLYKQHKAVKKDYDFLLVGMGAYTLTWFAKLISKKPVIFDAFVSVYITNVHDRQLAGPKSLKAKYFKFLDKLGCRFADRVLLDTQTQIDFFINNYKLARSKFIRVLVGSDDSIFFPNPKVNSDKEKFIVHWHGHIVPFHGVGIILKAAELLKDNKSIEFQIVTRFNSKYRKLRDQAEKLKLDNLKFHPETDYKGIAKFINQSDIVLGVFNDNLKSQVVVPNKIVEAAACKKPVITIKTKAGLEVFSEQSIEFIKPNDAEALAEAIAKLYKNESSRQDLANNAYQIFQSQLTPKVIVKNFIESLKSV